MKQTLEAVIYIFSRHVYFDTCNNLNTIFSLNCKAGGVEGREFDPLRPKIYSNNPPQVVL